MAASRRFLIIHNPTAGRRRRKRLDAVLARLAEAGCTVDLAPTGKRGDAEEFAAAAGAVDAVVAAGGDGTINEVANGLMRRQAQGLPPIPLGIVPLGTANVLAAEIGLADNADAVARALTGGVARPIFPGLANGRYFLCMAGAGLDAFVVQDVDLRLKWLLGKPAYAFQTIKRLLQPQERCYEVTVDGAPSQAAQIILAKGRYYAGTFVIAGAARITEPTLHACLFRHSGRWHALRYIAAVLLGFTRHLPDITVLPASQVTINGHIAHPVQGDGDIVTRLPADFTVASSGLPVLFPT
ncbi:diacylglycerol/lipid kinase family protein [Oceanibaculum pacificum]|uniref:DAGKc domain-containing protein n=1 Tax=Oceanibaculum pacificum TaxID=580166 RepID=A0A154WC16_9PROT|nr:YegS/Rv2252/BmrU family lipid kinase [Oceanibaculum pacificum]KZD11036.1 hypothetical protein AUP43_06020 [Oceanibaculum pacificum]